MNATRRARIEFFAQHAGYCTPPGRMLCAKYHADAEEWAEAEGLEVSWEWEDDVDLSWADDETLERVQSGRYEVLMATVSHGAFSAGLGNIVVDTADRTYPRVVAAELFAELRDQVNGHWVQRLKVSP